LAGTNYHLMDTQELELSPSAEMGSLGVVHLKRYWQKAMAKRQGTLKQGALHEEWQTDTILLGVLGLGLEQTTGYVYGEAPTFGQFEEWILKVNNGFIPKEKILAFNNFILKDETVINNGEAEEDVLSDEDLAFWQTNGYVIVRNAVPKEDCDAVTGAICDFIDIKLDEPETWYKPHPGRLGIMVQLFQHPALEKNRKNAKIRRAYEQLWGRKDIWMNADRVGFNPPETAGYKFPGPYLHWDVSLDLPIPFGLQGILYLSDTAPNQGAFTLVPGFQHSIESWINSLPAGANPRQQNLYALGAKPIAANAGDFIIWHQALPHGSSPNTSTAPRIVQYIKYEPLDLEMKEVWK